MEIKNKLFSAFDFQQTRQKLSVGQHKITWPCFIHEFDHAKAAAEVELLPPTTVLIFATPKGVLR